MTKKQAKKEACQAAAAVLSAFPMGGKPVRCTAAEWVMVKKAWRELVAELKKRAETENATVD